jgi:DNA-binding beta-propeller fold protein YncE
LGTGTLKPLPFTGTPAPFDVKIDGNNHLYVTDALGSTNGLAGFTITPGTGALTATTTPTFATGASPIEIAIDPQSRFLYTSNNGGGSVSAFTIDSGSGNLGTVSGSPFTAGLGAGSQPTGAAVDPSGKFLYVTAAGPSFNSVVGFQIAQTGTVGALSSPSSIGAGTSPALLLSTLAPVAPATPPTSVPAASAWSLMALGLLLAGFSGLLYRRACR